MMDRSDVRELAIAEGLDDCLDRILAAVRPGWRLEVDVDGDPSRPGVDKIGGHPDLVAGEAWPVSARGARMVFLAQIDCSRLPGLPGMWPDPRPWPHEGKLIRVFANLLEWFGEPCAARVFLTDPGSRLTRTSAPEIDTPLVAGAPYDREDVLEDYAVLAEAAVRAVPFLTVPEVLPGVIDDRWEMSDRADRYLSFADRLRIDGAVGAPHRHGSDVHHLLGEASSIQDDVREMPTELESDGDAARQWEIAPDPALGTPDAWRPLLALHFDQRMKLYLGDGGALHVMVPVCDLVTNRLDRLVCDFSSS